MSPPDSAPELRERPFVRRRAMRASIVGLVAGLVFGGVVTLTYFLAGFDEGLGALFALVGLLTAVYGATTGWLWGASSAHRAFYRLARHQPDATAFIATTVDGARSAKRFESICQVHGALATEGT